jgi:hypothetical protein
MQGTKRDCSPAQPVHWAMKLLARAKVCLAGARISTELGREAGPRALEYMRMAPCDHQMGRVARLECDFEFWEWQGWRRHILRISHWDGNMLVWASAAACSLRHSVVRSCTTENGEEGIWAYRDAKYTR